MLTWRAVLAIAFSVMSLALPVDAQEPAGSIRGVVYDQEFDAPLAAAQVTNVETGEKVTTGDQGNFAFGEVRPGKYTLVFAKEGYVRQVRSDVVVVEGRLTDLTVHLSGEFTEMDEFVVQDVLQLGGGSEASLLQLRFESPALVDSIGADLMSRAGASDAASALRLVSGATVQDGKYAVVRGLPDRYVSSQMNGVRLPTADEDKRAVELDQFPAAVIESIQVSKTFTPDQQGDASGGAVDVRLKGIPDETIVQLKGQYTHDTNVAGSDFLTYEGGGVDFLGDEQEDPQLQNLGGNWDGAAGTTTGDPPLEHKWSFVAGGKYDLGDGVKIGGLASLFYERASSYFDDGKSDSYWVANPGEPMTPETGQGTPQDGDFRTSLFDVTESAQGVQWGGLGTLGLETEKHSIGLTWLYTRTAEDKATLATDTRGKDYFFPGYDVNDPKGTGNEPENRLAAPWLRLETLEYTERTTQTLQLDGQHELPFDGFELGDLFRFRAPEVEWRLAGSSAGLYQPDKRQFGALWLPRSFNPGVPPFFPPTTSPPIWLPYKPAANFNLGNFQRIWKEIEEESRSAAVDLELPFDQWGDVAGYLKFGWFADRVDREFDQDSFSNFGDAGASYLGGWDDPWSAQFPFEDHPITESTADVDYEGELDITAWYGMADLPLTSWLSVVGGARLESTGIGIVNDPEEDAVWYPPGATAPVSLNPGDGDVSFDQDDVLPSIGLVFEPDEHWTLRTSYSETIARQTFKELTPILQQEYLGGEIFIGNPELQMSDLENYDVRLDYRPQEDSLFSVSWFKKDVEDPIEYVQRLTTFTFTTPVNYPEGELEGIELEARQGLERAWSALAGVSIGANATWIESEVQLPPDEIAAFEDPGIAAPITSRDMTNTPEYLYNVYVTWDVESTRSQLALFYTRQGDTLVAGAGQSNGNFVPSVYAEDYDTLNLTFTQKLGSFLRFQVQAKNLTNPRIEEVYRSEYIDGDVTKTSYTKGIEYSIGFTMEFSF